ncbi:recombinase family protein [Bradyrhizobium diazoefficiens]|uniref:recombinase family protein n=1 Tax=Bradyrhizobium diazoefficiens TaxID=1355477 RepID=UPI0015B41FF1|nr:recombinase family protein [Bradyrhizobium diazoefficiens]QLD45627.1 recombinase family protein [Bradyrhizobium diazoefficiens]
MTATGKWVAYYRVSTDKQGRSGLGLEAQRASVRTYLNGGDWKLIKEFTEVESGKRSDRQQLQAALAACKLHGAKLVIAKLDRLSRDAHFLLGLQKAGVDFVAADMPDANRMTIGLLAVVAEHEREMISARTKAALQAAKARNVKLGGRRTHADGSPVTLTLAAIEKGRETIAERADEKAARIMPAIRELQEAGITSLTAIAARLNDQGIPTPRGGRWQAVQVQRVLDRLPQADAVVTSARK